MNEHQSNLNDWSLALEACLGIAGETDTQRQKRKEDLYMQAKMLGLLINQEEKKDD